IRRRARMSAAKPAPESGTACLERAIESQHCELKRVQNPRRAARPPGRASRHLRQHGRWRRHVRHRGAASGECRPVSINALAGESLNLAYHGARAENQEFKIRLERSFDPTTGEVDLFPQEMTRALLNLISNGFYAATKRKAKIGFDEYEPTLSVATKKLGSR